MISTPYVFNLNNKKGKAGKDVSGIANGKKLRAARKREATVMPTQVLFKDEEHANYLLEDSTHGKFGYSNQYLIIHNGRGILLNPDGRNDYSNVKEGYLAGVPAHKIEYLFLSHQDPDLMVSANGWLIDQRSPALPPEFCFGFHCTFRCGGWELGPHLLHPQGRYDAAPRRRFTAGHPNTFSAFIHQFPDL